MITYTDVFCHFYISGLNSFPSTCSLVQYQPFQIISALHIYHFYIHQLCAVQRAFFPLHNEPCHLSVWLEMFHGDLLTKHQFGKYSKSVEADFITAGGETNLLVNSADWHIELVVCKIHPLAVCLFVSLCLGLSVESLGTMWSWWWSLLEVVLCINISFILSGVSVHQFSFPWGGTLHYRL